MFDLDSEIAAWSAALAPRCGRVAEVAELEDHLRSDVDSLVAEGTPVERAFELAVNRIGKTSELDAEYEKNRSLLDRVHSRLAHWDRRLARDPEGGRLVGISIIFASVIIAVSIMLSAADIDSSAAFGYLLVVVAPLWLTLWLISRRTHSHRRGP